MAKRMEIVCRVEGSKYLGFRCDKRYDAYGLTTLAKAKRGEKVCSSVTCMKKEA